MLPFRLLSELRYCVPQCHADKLCVSVHRAAHITYRPTARRISLGGEGNALYPVLSSCCCCCCCCDMMPCTSVYSSFDITHRTRSVRRDVESGCVAVGAANQWQPHQHQQPVVTSPAALAKKPPPVVSKLCYLLVHLLTHTHTHTCTWFLFSQSIFRNYSRLNRYPEVNFWQSLWQDFHGPDALPAVDQRRQSTEG